MLEQVPREPGTQRVKLTRAIRCTTHHHHLRSVHARGQSCGHGVEVLGERLAHATQHRGRRCVRRWHARHRHGQGIHRLRICHTHPDGNQRGGSERFRMEHRRAGPANAQQPLRALCLAHGHGEHAAHAKLRQQWRGQSHAPHRHHDGVEWRGFGAANGGRPLQHRHVAASKLAQPFLRRSGARGAPFDGDDQPHHPAQHGGQVAGARADLQHAMTRPQLACLQQHRHREGGQHLRGGVERQRNIMPRELAVTLRHERLARNVAQRLQQRGITHAARDHLLSNHSILRAINCVHRMLLPVGVTAVRVALRDERRRSGRAKPAHAAP